MKNKEDAAQMVVVTGNATVDWNLLCFRATSEGRQQWNAQDQTNYRPWHPKAAGGPKSLNHRRNLGPLKRRCLITPGSSPAF